jgi:hypothetical protein
MTDDEGFGASINDVLVTFGFLGFGQCFDSKSRMQNISFSPLLSQTKKIVVRYALALFQEANLFFSLQ